MHPVAFIRLVGRTSPRPRLLSQTRTRCSAERALTSSATSLTTHSQPKPRKRALSVRKTLAELPQRATDKDGQELPPLPPFNGSGVSSRAVDSTSEGATAPPTPDVATATARWRAAVQSGAYPDTPLAREVWTHTQAHPGDIVLLRVGMFYESYFAQAPLVAALLQIQLTSKKYADKSGGGASDGENEREGAAAPQPPLKSKSKRKSKAKSAGVSADEADPADPAPSPSSPRKTLSFPFAGFPTSQRDKYLKELLALGHSVVLVEERDAYNAEVDRNRVSSAGGVGQKERYVARKLTPGTLMLESWAGAGAEDNRYLLAVALDVRADGPGGAGAGTVDATDPAARRIGLAWIDISTDRAITTKTSSLAELEHDLARLAPVEVVCDPRVKATAEGADPGGNAQAGDAACKVVMDQLAAADVFLSLRSWPRGNVDRGPESDLDGDALPPLESRAARAIANHLAECLRESMPELLPPNHQSPTATMKIDASTLLSLEIRQTIRAGQGTLRGPHSSAARTTGTLLSVIKRTLTPSGTRLLVNTLCAPSARVDVISARHDLVDAFAGRKDLREDLRDRLREMTLRSAGAAGSDAGTRGDLGRIVQRFLAWRDGAAGGFGSGLPLGRCLWDLKTAIEGMSWMQARVAQELALWRDASPVRARLERWHHEMRRLDDLATLIGESVEESALTSAIEAAESAEGSAESSQGDGGVAPPPLSKAQQEAADRAAMWWIKPNFSPDLEALHALNDDLQVRKSALQVRLQNNYNASSLEIKATKQGFLVHVKVEHSRDLEASPDMILVSSVRSMRYYVYAPWTTLGHEMQQASDRLLVAQQDAFKQLREAVLLRESDLLTNAALMSELDLTMGFAQVAEELRFVRPTMNDGLTLSIVNGRHPTVETGLRKAFAPRNFVPNSLQLSPSAFLHMITGPNMGGKSTVLRQTAIIAILAQAGSFVPADKADIGVVDAVFSRVGARDDLYMDRSTFMVEMHETAYILRRATERSLVIMDEIGRGTTLQSGLSIAYATLDHIYRNIRCRTLFATHIHELADKVCQPDTKEPLPGIQFWCTDLEEMGTRFSYSYKLHPGVNRQSHAIKVASQAGMPASFLKVAEQTLRQLESPSTG